MTSSTYILCERLIALGLTAGLADKLDVFFAVGRLSTDEYTGLIAQLTPTGGEDSNA